LESLKEGKKPINVDETIILKEILKKQMFVADWFHLAQDRGKCYVFYTL
jgi:hypothetical protein